MRTSPGGIGGSDCARREGNKHISATRRSSTRAAVEFADGVVIRVQRWEVEGIIAKLLELVTAQPVLSMIDHVAKDSQTRGFGTAVTITDYIRYAQAYSPTVARAVPFTALAVAGTKPDPVTVTAVGVVPERKPDRDDPVNDEQERHRHLQRESGWARSTDHEGEVSL
jgi:hypothetical protein